MLGNVSQLPHHKTQVRMSQAITHKAWQKSAIMHSYVMTVALMPGGHSEDDWRDSTTCRLWSEASPVKNASEMLQKTSNMQNN